MPAPAEEDMRVTALETKLAIVSEELSYWKNIAQQHQRMEGRKRAGLPDDNTGLTVNNSMSVNMSAKEIIVENIERSTITTTREEPITRNNTEVTENENTQRDGDDQNKRQEDGRPTAALPSSVTLPSL